MNNTILNPQSLREGADWLAVKDPILAGVLTTYGYPPLWQRPATFSTLVHIILEQQVSLSSANATYDKLINRLGVNFSATDFSTLTEEALQRMGITRQKIGYTSNLASAIISGSLDLNGLQDIEDVQVIQRLTALKGIGRWTADVYLSECLMRPDILPRGDIALQEAYKVLYGLESRPHSEALEQFTLSWKPWRSVGTRMLWHYYLSVRNRSATIGG
jgi:DNA-3-methyladenine glycosylase II